MKIKVIAVLLCVCIMLGSFSVISFAKEYDIPYEGYAGKWMASDEYVGENWAVTATVYTGSKNYLVFTGVGDMIDWDPDVYDYMG